ncbi:hypothetical protein ABW54_30450 [Burkholderia cenocepacia]|nr:hypothetical protein ABW54_30450 [Burkholderia cenocepacia]
MLLFRISQFQSSIATNDLINKNLILVSCLLLPMLFIRTNPCLYLTCAPLIKAIEIFVFPIDRGSIGGNRIVA